MVSNLVTKIRGFEKLSMNISQEKKKNRVNVRFNDSQMESLDRICEEKGIKSRSKMLKSALDLVTKGTSDIDFGIKSDFTKEERKTIQFEDDKKIMSDCPHCTGKIRLDPEHYKKFKKMVTQNFIPGYRCAHGDCKQVHSNENYSTRPAGICSKCYQFSNKDSGSCPWCRYTNTIMSITDSKLSELNIPYPN